MPEPVIVAATRTPIGRAMKGSLVGMRPDDLAVVAVKGALEQVPELDPSMLEDLILGCGLPGGEQGYNMGRVVATLLGQEGLPGTTVTRYCASSTQAIRMAAHAIKAGEGDAFVAAGVECVSRFVKGSSDGQPDTQNPQFAQAQARTAERAQSGDDWAPAEGLPDIYIAMGHTAEHVAALKGVSRQRMDEFAARSQEAAVSSIDSGFFKREITPVQLPDGSVMETDDGPRRGTTVEKLSELQPVFKPGGTVTAGNACPLNDGAAAVIVMSDTRARELGITPKARIVATGVSALNPEIMGLGPIEASRQALARAGLTIDDIDLVEINEAFAAQVIPSADELGIPWEKLNVNGGSIAVGHPFGMTGARIATTLLNGLEWQGGRYGLETMCVGGGQGMALIIERLT